MWCASACFYPDARNSRPEWPRYSAAFRPLKDFEKEVGEFARYLKSTPPSEGSPGVFYPGEIEHIREQQRRRDGIEVEDATWDKLKALATDYKLAAELGLK